MKNKLILAGLIACGSLVINSQAAITANLNDLILGFHATGGQGQSINLEVDLGPISNYSGVSQTANTVISQLNVADIVAAYGTNWASRTDLYWGIVGSTGRISSGPAGATQPAPTVWATCAETTVGTQSTPWFVSSLSRGAVSQASQAIESLYNSAPGSLTGTTPTINSTYSSNINPNLAGSWSYQESIQAGEGFNYFNPTVDVSTTIAAGSYSAADLYQVASGTTAPTYVGTFGLNASGVLTYSGSPTYFKTAQGTNSFTINPISQTAIAGGTIVFNAAATGTPAPSYQWYFNGNIIAGETNSTLVLTNVQANKTGSYTVVATNSSGSNTSAAATLSLASAGSFSRLINLSVLAPVANNGTLTLGLVNGGPGTSGSSNLLIRASGQALAGFGLTGLMQNPTESVLKGSTVVASNDDWNSPTSNGTAVTAADAATGAFANTSANPNDAALVQALPSVAGGYTVQVTGNGGQGGQVIAEIYDATTSPTATTTRLVNVSSLNAIGAGGNLTAGFVISGASKTVLIRATGPSLANFGLPNVLADPKLVVYNLSVTPNVVVATNTGWANSAQLGSFSATVGAQPFNTGSKDSAVLVTLPPGNYSAVVTSASGGTGSALVEVYEVQ